MAIYGMYAGAIKATYLELTAIAPNGSNLLVDISSGIPTPPRAGATYVALRITTTGDTRIALGEAATATSFLISSGDEFICTIASDRPIGIWGVGGAPTVLMKRFIV